MIVKGDVRWKDGQKQTLASSSCLKCVHLTLLAVVGLRPPPSKRLCHAEMFQAEKTTRCHLDASPIGDAGPAIGQLCDQLTKSILGYAIPK